MTNKPKWDRRADEILISGAKAGGTAEEVAVALDSAGYPFTVRQVAIRHGKLAAGVAGEGKTLPALRGPGYEPDFAELAKMLG